MPTKLSMLAISLSLNAVAACAQEAAPVPVPRPSGDATEVAKEQPLTVDVSRDPIAAARAAVRRGDWRLKRGIAVAVPGIVCFTPDGMPAGMARYGGPMADNITQEVSNHDESAGRYNRTIVEAPNFPDADLCRAMQPNVNFPSDFIAVSQPAREVNRPPESLHEAARRGTIEDVRRFLAITPRNQPDAYGMTPLAWAAARGRLDVWQTLVASGEVSGAQPDDRQRDDLYWAIATGREDIVAAALALPREAARQAIPGLWLTAAIESGNPKIVDAVFALPHKEQPSLFGEAESWRVSAVEAALKRGGQPLANIVLGKAVFRFRLRPDLLRLALRYGAQAALVREPGDTDSQTPLYAAATSYDPAAPEAVALLLAAGVDPDALSKREPALRTLAFRLMRDSSADTRSWTKKIAGMLLAAGAHLEAPSRTGKPLVWEVLTPMFMYPEKIDVTPAAPDALAFLAAKGMDINAPWRGRRVLGLVERQLGQAHPVAAALRQLGAQR